MKYKSLFVLIGILLLTSCGRNINLTEPDSPQLKDNLLFVCNTGSNYVSVIDTENNTVYATIEAEKPWGLTFSNDRKKGYISCVGSGQLEIVNGYNFIPIEYINIGASSPVGVIVYSSSDRAYVVCYAFDSLQIIDLEKNECTGEINLDDGPQWMTTSSDEAKIYVVNTLSDTLSVIDVAVGDVIKIISLPYYSYGITRSPFDGKLYIASFGCISIINPANDILEESIYLSGGTKPWVEFGSASRYAYISDLPLDKVIVYDLVNREEYKEIFVDDRPHCLARNGDGTKIYVSCAGSNTINVINTLTNTVEAKISVGEAPIGLYIRN